MVEAVDQGQFNNEIKEAGRNYLAQWDSHSEVLAEADIGYFVKSGDREGIPVIVTKYEAGNLTEEKVDEWMADPGALAQKTNSKIQV